MPPRCLCREYLIVLLLLATPAFAGPRYSSRIVEIQTGAIRGIILELNSRHLEPVEVFRGVPYAAPPVGSLRFRPPQPPLNWPGTRLADTFGAVCPQKNPDISNRTQALLYMPKGRYHYLKKLVPLLVNQSEDCLFLNIYVPGSAYSYANMGSLFANKIDRSKFRTIFRCLATVIHEEPVAKPYASCRKINQFRSDSQITQEKQNSRHMQPCQLPEFYKSRADFSSAMRNETANHKPNFSASTTYKSLTMPLKISRLANPFPDPVKQMPSDTVSDQEKAERMFSESQMNMQMSKRQNSR